MEPSNDLAVQVASLRKTYGHVVAVDDVSFTVERGSIFCMIGPNGAGKTTTIECLEGLRQPDDGSVLVDGLDPIADRAEFVHRIGVQLQEIGVPPSMKVREALRLFAALYRTSVSLTELTGELGLDDSVSKTYGSLSGGQKRRVNIALALVGAPEIVFPGRAHHRPRPRVQLPVLGVPQAAEQPRHDGRGDHALHGGGAGVLRRGAPHERWQGRGVRPPRAAHRRLGAGGASRPAEGGPRDHGSGRAGDTVGRRPRPHSGD